MLCRLYFDDCYHCCYLVLSPLVVEGDPVDQMIGLFGEGSIKKVDLLSTLARMCQYFGPSAGLLAWVGRLDQILRAVRDLLIVYEDNGFYRQIFFTAVAESMQSVCRFQTDRYSEDDPLISKKVHGYACHPSADIEVLIERHRMILSSCESQSYKTAKLWSEYFVDCFINKLLDIYCVCADVSDKEKIAVYILQLANRQDGEADHYFLERKLRMGLAIRDKLGQAVDTESFSLLVSLMPNLVEMDDDTESDLTVQQQIGCSRSVSVIRQFVLPQFEELSVILNMIKGLEKYKLPGSGGGWSRLCSLFSPGAADAIKCLIGYLEQRKEAMFSHPGGVDVSVDMGSFPGIEFLLSRLSPVGKLVRSFANDPRQCQFLPGCLLNRLVRQEEMPAVEL